MDDAITASNRAGAGRDAPLRFGWRVPMWDPDQATAPAWLPQISTSLDALRGKYHSVWLSDHLVPGTPWMPPEPDTLECWTATAYLAARHPEYHYGQIVLGNSYRHPPLLAKMASTFQLMSGGRLILGIGAGWMESEYRMYGYEFPSAAVRIRQLDEAVQIIRRMWTQSPASFQGAYYTVDNAFANPLPSPAPPLMIGAAGEKLSLRVVAKHADWWDYSGRGADEFARKAKVLEAHCDAVGRDPTSILYSFQSQTVSIADSEAEARAVAERSTLYQNSGKDGTLIGTPEQVTARVQEYAALGIRNFIVRFPDYPSTEMALRFASEVAPKI